MGIAMRVPTSAARGSRLAMRVALIARRFDPAGRWDRARPHRHCAMSCRSRTRHNRLYLGGARHVAAVRPWFRSARDGRIRALANDALCMGGAGAGTARGRGLVLSFARAVGADILRSGGGAHSAYLRRGAAMARRLGGGRDASAAVSSRANDNRALRFQITELRRAIAVSNLVRTQLIDEFGSIRPKR